MKAKVGDNCRFCLRPITQEVVDQKRHLKSENARASVRKAIANGTHIGALRKRDDEKIRMLCKEGHSMREIAFRAGCTLGSVQASLKEVGLKTHATSKPGQRVCRKPKCWCRNSGSQPAEKK
jgi:DNA invertase Pin-like site-specific DNA recombinase